MADVFSTIAAAIGVADVGARVSAKLYTFGVLVASADETISSISKDVALTSTVLKELGQILAKDRPESPIVTKTAIMNIKETVQECDKAFGQIDSILLRRVPKLRLGKGDHGPKAAVILERFGWQAVEPKVRLLRSNIDRLKSSLLLMLNVLMLAWFISDRNGPQSVIDSKKTLCESLIHSKEAYDSKFQELRISSDQSIEASKLTPVKLMSKVSPTLSINPGAQHSFNPHPNREPSCTQLMSESHQNLGEGALSDQTNLASYKMTVLRNLQQDYNDLFKSLIEEVRAQKYDIDKGSRSRIESQIGISRSNELSHLDLMASTTSALRFPSYRQNAKAEESNDSISHTVVRDHDILQATCTTPAHIVNSDTNAADRERDDFQLIQRSRIPDAESVTSQDDSVVMESSTGCLCPHKSCKRSQGEGFSHPSHLAQHMRQVHSEVPVIDMWDTKRTKLFFPRLPLPAKNANFDDTRSVPRLARPLATEARERHATRWTKIIDPPTDSESQRARLGRYTKYHNPPGLGHAGGRGAYDVAGPAKPPPPKPRDSTNQKSKRQRHTCEAIVLNDASSNQDEDTNMAGSYKPSSSVLPSASRQETSEKAQDAQKRSFSTPSSVSYMATMCAAPTRELRLCSSAYSLPSPPKIEILPGFQSVFGLQPQVGFYSNDEPLVSQRPKSTISDLLALWTTIQAA